MARDSYVSIPSFVGSDKLAHLMMYMVLSAVILWDMRSLKMDILWKAVVAIVFSSVFGGFIEIMQECFFYPRTGDWLDWLADCIGAVCGFLLWKAIEMIKNARGVVK